MGWECAIGNVDTVDLCRVKEGFCCVSVMRCESFWTFGFIPWLLLIGRSLSLLLEKEGKFRCRCRTIFDYDKWLNVCPLGKPQNPFEAYRSVKKTSCDGNYILVFSSLYTKCTITSGSGHESVWIAPWISSPYNNEWSFPFHSQVHLVTFRFTPYPDKRSATISSSCIWGGIQHDYRSMLHTCASGHRHLTRKRRHSRWSACVS